MLAVDRVDVLGWWLPGTTPIPVSGMFVQVMEYRQPSRAMSLMLVAPSAIAAAIEASTTPGPAAATCPSSAAPCSGRR
jgi:hypothetical protein